MFGRSRMPAPVVQGVQTVGAPSVGEPPWQLAHSVPSVLAALVSQRRFQLPASPLYAVGPWQVVKAPPFGPQVGVTASTKPTLESRWTFGRLASMDPMLASKVPSMWRPTGSSAPRCGR